MDSTNKELNMVYGDVTLGVSGNDFNYIFSYQTGGMESLVLQGKEWLYRTPKPTFWRALTDNDRGNKFHLKSGMWLGADQFIHHTDTEVKIDGRSIALPIAPVNNSYGKEEKAKSAEIMFTYETITVPAAKVTVSYLVKSCGDICVSVHYYGQKGLPELPVFGMRFIMPTGAAGYCYHGLSGETYPDRMAGGTAGIYHIAGMPVTPYLVPQDCGMHMDTSWVEIYRDTALDNRKKENAKTGFRISCEGKPFAFSCLPYTAEELENATHQEELPPARRTVLGIFGAVRGVGGIDSWGSDVEPEYCIDAGEDISFAFLLSIPD